MRIVLGKKELVVVVGDFGVGKTTLIKQLRKAKEVQSRYVFTELCEDDQTVPEGCPKYIIVCFSLYDSQSLDNVTKKWYKLIKRRFQPVPEVFVVGTFNDLSELLKQRLCEAGDIRSASPLSLDAPSLFSTLQSYLPTWFAANLRSMLGIKRNRVPKINLSYIDIQETVESTETSEQVKETTTNYGIKGNQGKGEDESFIEELFPTTECRGNFEKDQAGKSEIRNQKKKSAQPNQAQAVFFSDLPRELIGLVISNLDSSSLWHMFCTSKRFRSIILKEVHKRYKYSSHYQGYIQYSPHHLSKVKLRLLMDELPFCRPESFLTLLRSRSFALFGSSVLLSVFFFLLLSAVLDRGV